MSRYGQGMDDGFNPEISSFSQDFGLGGQHSASNSGTPSWGAPGTSTPDQNGNHITTSNIRDEIRMALLVRGQWYQRDPSDPANRALAQNLTANNAIPATQEWYLSRLIGTANTSHIVHRYYGDVPVSSWQLRSRDFGPLLALLHGNLTMMMLHFPDNLSHFMEDMRRCLSRSYQFVARPTDPAMSALGSVTLGINAMAAEHGLSYRSTVEEARGYMDSAEYHRRLNNQYAFLHAAHPELFGNAEVSWAELIIVLSILMVVKGLPFAVSIYEQVFSHRAIYVQRGNLLPHQPDLDPLTSHAASQLGNHRRPLYQGVLHVFVTFDQATRRRVFTVLCPPPTISSPPPMLTATSLPPYQIPPHQQPSPYSVQPTARPTSYQQQSPYAIQPTARPTPYHQPSPYYPTGPPHSTVVPSWVQPHMAQPQAFSFQPDPANYPSIPRHITTQPQRPSFAPLTAPTTQGDPQQPQADIDDDGADEEESDGGGGIDDEQDGAEVQDTIEEDPVANEKDNSDSSSPSEAEPEEEGNDSGVSGAVAETVVEEDPVVVEDRDESEEEAESSGNGEEVSTGAATTGNDSATSQERAVVTSSVPAAVDPPRITTPTINVQRITTNTLPESETTGTTYIATTTGVYRRSTRHLPATQSLILGPPDDDAQQGSLIQSDAHKKRKRRTAASSDGDAADKEIKDDEDDIAAPPRTRGRVGPTPARRRRTAAAPDDTEIIDKRRPHPRGTGARATTRKSRKAPKGKGWTNYDKSYPGLVPGGDALLALRGFYTGTTITYGRRELCERISHLMGRAYPQNNLLKRENAAIQRHLGGMEEFKKWQKGRGHSGKNDTEGKGVLGKAPKVVIPVVWSPKRYVEEAAGRDADGDEDEEDDEGMEGNEEDDEE